MSTEPALMTLTAVAKAIASKQFSSHEVTRSCLHRVAQWQPKLNAFMAVEAEAALKAADEADAALAKGQSGGSLHGVPLAHKDMYYDAGHVVTCGSLIRRDFVATTTSTALQRCRWWSSPTARPATIIIMAPSTIPGSPATSPVARRRDPARRSPRG
jgi:aspartyl-tRNA(Asn)/glutamyl-tRNA(Gln) amidotransferase subunit A